MNVISVYDVKDNPFTLIGKDWMLITAAKKDGTLNTMTASWGGLGILWGKPVAYIVVRPGRYTYEFLESADDFSLSFLDEEYRSALNLCGSRSGRDTDKISAAGLTTVYEDGVPYFEEARMVMLAGKLYFQDINPNNFILPEIDKNYPEKDYHRMYIGGIKKVLVHD